MTSGFEKKKSEKGYKWAGTALSALVVFLVVFVALFIFKGPFSSGNLSVSGLCGNLSMGGRVADFSGEVYYSGQDGIYSVNQNGTATKVADGKALSLNVEKNFLYYVENGKLTVLKNMVSASVLADDCASVSVNGSWIYYTDSKGQLYKMTTSGTGVRRIGDVVVKGTFAVDSGYVYYTDDRGLVKIRTNGLKDTEVILADDCTGYFAYYNYVIYYQTAEGVKSMSADNGSGKTLRSDSQLFNYGNNKFVYLSQEGICVVDNATDAQQVKVLKTETVPTALYITTSGVWYDTADGTLKFVEFPSADSTDTESEALSEVSTSDEAESVVSSDSSVLSSVVE